jgi:hypothetical protein
MSSNKYVSSEKLNELDSNYKNDKIKIIVEKNCGYQYLVYLPNKATLNDLYRFIDIDFLHSSSPINLYYGKNYIIKSNTVQTPVNNKTEEKVNVSTEVNENYMNNKEVNNEKCNCNKNIYDGGEKIYIPRNTEKISEYINDNKIKACTQLPSKVYYKFYLDLCKKH